MLYWYIKSSQRLDTDLVLFRPSLTQQTVSKEIYRPPGARSTNFAPILKMLDQREAPSKPAGAPKRKRHLPVHVVFFVRMNHLSVLSTVAVIGQPKQARTRPKTRRSANSGN